MNHEISVVLPFFNAENTLKRAIESILNQRYLDFELLLVDNLSTDGSIQIARKFASEDKRIRLLKESKPGVANAMNCGLQNSRGSVVARMDADDVSSPNRLEKQLQFLRENPDIGLVGSTVRYFPHNKNTVGFKRFVRWVNSFCSPVQIELNRFVEIPVVNPTIMFRREIFEKYGGCIHGDFPEDYEMQLRYLETGIKMAKIEEPLLEWHDYTTRLTRTDERYSTDAFFKVKARYFKKWSEKNNPFHPVIWVWGAGRKTRQRAKLLEKEGLSIEGFIDVVKSKTSVKKVLHFEEIPNSRRMFVVSLVTNPGAGQQIKEFLKKRNYIEGEDFILMG
ncbi:glycosyltransferase family 2 protein [Maribellus maritimus]|uniref:glycosyltransferase family 2 protein n=1 Tax=Maribellus maritimus TaxID=2870838 RepID=UPI001EEB3F1D|nr:glycosyltransferase family 2 protein [Maribellus maritimus]MCG6189626.1 glycosyltransferase [Maribellus maritimus]